MTRRHQPSCECANCGATVPAGAKSCPECGADERTGLFESSVYDGIDLPDSAFDGNPAPDRGRRVNGIPWYVWLVALLVLAAFAAAYVL